MMHSKSRARELEKVINMSELNRPQTAQAMGIMTGIEINPEKQATLANWDSAPYNRWAFQHVPSLIPCARIGRGTQLVTEFESNPQNLQDFEFVGPDSKPLTVGEMLPRTYTDAFLVLHKGKIVAENYYNGMKPDTQHLLMSCTKSYVGTLAGLFLEEGSLVLDKAITHYLPTLKNTGFDGATVRQVLDMNAGVKYSEAYEDPNSEVRLGEIAIGWKPQPQNYQGPIGQTNFTLSLKEKQFADGQEFSYRSVLTNVLALLMETISGKRLQQLLTEVYWTQLGCEWDAAITVDAYNTATAEGGLNACLRDWARFGQMMLQNGYYNGKQIIPESWVNDTRMGDHASRVAFTKSKYSELFPSGMYRNQCWCIDADQGIYAASGIHGQNLYINPKADVVIAKFSTHPKAEDHTLFMTQFLGMNAIAEALA